MLLLLPFVIGTRKVVIIGEVSCTKCKLQLQLTGCRHGLAQWAVNMFQGELQCIWLCKLYSPKENDTSWCQALLRGYSLQVLEVKKGRWS